MFVPKFTKALAYTFGLALQMKRSYEIRYRDIAMLRVTLVVSPSQCRDDVCPSARVVEKQRDILLFHLSLYPRLCNDCS